MYENYFGFVYETTNLVNNKKYIGKCIFSRKNDWKTYLGSGVYLKRAIKHWGRENFKREILFLARDEEELNELEEVLILLSNAVNSPNYYNLKNTAIGGDVFTSHPRKEDIREMRRVQMTGASNHQFGKVKTEKMIQSVKQANSKKIMVDGVLYSSVSDYSKKFNILNSTVGYRLSSPYYPQYLFVDDKGKPIPKIVQEKKKQSRKSKPILVNGKRYESVSEGVKDLKIGRATLLTRLKDSDYPNYQYLICEKCLTTIESTLKDGSE